MLCIPGITCLKVTNNFMWVFEATTEQWRRLHLPIWANTLYLTSRLTSMYLFLVQFSLENLMFTCWLVNHPDPWRAGALAVEVALIPEISGQIGDSTHIFSRARIRLWTIIFRNEMDKRFYEFSGEKMAVPTAAYQQGSKTLFFCCYERGRKYFQSISSFTGVDGFIAQNLVVFLLSLVLKWAAIKKMLPCRASKPSPRGTTLLSTERAGNINGHRLSPGRFRLLRGTHLLTTSQVGRTTGATGGGGGYDEILLT